MTLYHDAQRSQVVSPVRGRRGSLAALGAATLALLARPTATSARKKRRKNKKSCKKQIEKRTRQTCGRQIGECEAGFLANLTPELVPCCQFLATCDFPAFFACAA